MDSGNFLFRRAYQQQPKPQDIIKANGIAKIYTHMAYDAVNVGADDLVNGIEFLTSMTSVPWTSSSFYTPSNDPIFPPYLLRNTGEIRTAIIGISSPLRRDAPEVVYKSWQDTFPQILPEVEKAADAIILLSTLPMEENIAIAQQHPRVKIIITSLSVSQNRKPEMVHNTLITQTANRGKYLGYLRLQFLEHQKWHTDKSSKTESLKQRLKPLEYRIKRLESIKVQTSEQKELYNRLRKQKNDLLESHREAEKSKNDPDDQKGTQFFSQFIALTEGLPDDTTVVEMIDSIKNEILDSGR